MSFLLVTTLWFSSCGGQAVTSLPNNAANNTSADANSGPSFTAASVTIDSSNGVKIIGTYLPAPKPNSPAVLLLHQWQSDRHSYDDLAKKLQARNINVLSVDGRGFGESTHRADGSTVSAGRTDADVRAMLGDVDAAFQFLLKQPNVNAKRVGIIGASYGSSLAIIYASEHKDVAAVALLSPGLNYFGNLKTEPAVRKFEADYPSRQLLFFAAEDDKESADAVRKLNPIRVDNPLYGQNVFSKGGHGTALLKVGADQDISDFFAGVFDLANLNNLKN
ncbi:MAG: alpha/beta fold hydrolase [Acidobacteria bacterium]|nr:alpha/beta fold hydrolase [Acidobacteriota bacterium]